MSPTSYTLMEALRLFNVQLGQNVQSLAQSETSGLLPEMRALLRGWGEVTEATFARIGATPQWRLEGVTPQSLFEKPFGRITHFVQAAPFAPRKVLLIAPLSGHHATLLHRTVEALLPHAEVFITEWANARDIPLSAGRFDIEDYTTFVIEAMRRLGPDLHVIAVCQPAPLALAAAAVLAEDEPDLSPKSLTLIGGPIDPAANPTEVSDFGALAPLAQLERSLIRTVPAPFEGAGRRVYPGGTQLMSFMAMNLPDHAAAFQRQIMAAARGEAHADDRHNRFYNEYLAVMDLPAEFYLSTVERIFQNRDIARNAFGLKGTPVDLGAIRTTALLTIEGGRDDITAPGQCAAAHGLLTGLAETKKAHHLEEEAGHYGIFAGSAFVERILPKILAFIDRV